MACWRFKRVKGVLESDGVIGHAIADGTEVCLHVKPRSKRTNKLIVVRGNDVRAAACRPAACRRSGYDIACRTIADGTHGNHLEVITGSTREARDHLPIDDRWIMRECRPSARAALAVIDCIIGNDRSRGRSIPRESYLTVTGKGLKNCGSIRGADIGVIEGIDLTRG